MADDDTTRHLDLALLAADARHRIDARRGLLLDRASAVSRATDLRRARAKGQARGDEARAALDMASERLVVARGDSERSHVEGFRPTTSVLHGRIHRADGAGIAGLVVRAIGADGRPAGETKTGDRGYFRIDLADRPTGRLPTIDAGTPASVRVGYHIAIFDGQRELVAEKGATLVRTGRSVYREIQVVTEPR
jgi:hypothetical protein